MGQTFGVLSHPLLSRLGPEWQGSKHGGLWGRSQHSRHTPALFFQIKAKEALGGVYLTSQVPRNINYSQLRWALGIVLSGSSWWVFSWVVISSGCTDHFSSEESDGLGACSVGSPSSLLLLPPPLTPPAPMVWLSSPGLPALWPGDCLQAESPETVAPLLISLLQGPQWCWLSSVRKITYFVWFSSCLNKENESSPCYYLLAWNRFLGFTISLMVLRGFVSCHNFSISENILSPFCPFGREILGRLNNFCREILGKWAERFCPVVVNSCRL